MVQGRKQKTNRLFRFWKLLRKAFIEMRRKDPLRMAGATAFFTTFALPPILIILFQLLSLFLNRKMLGGELRELLTNTFGPDSADQIRQTARGFRQLASNGWIAAGGFLFLLFVATTLFSVIKNTLNDLWNIAVKEKPGIRFRILLRARSLAVILLTGVLFLAGIVVDSIEILGGNYLDKIWPGGGLYFRSILNETVSAVICTIWFTVLFRYIADARPTWRTAIVGGTLTGILFTAGKLLLSTLMRNSQVDNIYGASGSIVLLLLFVFYSSFILYYGASFLNVYADAIRQPLQVVDKAYRYREVRVKEDDDA